MTTGRAGATILIVDDDESLRSAMRRSLELYDYEVLEAGDAFQARTVLAEAGERVELVIMDLVLPRLEGREAANLLLARQPDLRILFASGYTNKESLEMGALSPGDGFLRKPFDVAELLDAVDRALQRPRATE